ncbi:hypothetical protein [Microvirga vignae]|uniref:hypothetical protein n=1 Tax=Microvirga vignae TaxID=1225564 RepID=UPI001364977A|nr:hypothetical protein [Microvirga vignae]
MPKSREVHSIMSGAGTDKDWFPVGIAPRDGTPVILWMIGEETPPTLPQPVGCWSLNPAAGIGYWRIFGEPPRFCSDKQIRGWRPLLRES